MGKLKVGDTFDVVKWVESPFGDFMCGYIEKTCVRDSWGNIYTPCYTNGRLLDLRDFNGRLVKPIGKLTITKVK